MRTLQLSSAPRRVRLLALLLLGGLLFTIPAGNPPVSKAEGTIIAQQDVSSGDDQSEGPQISVGSDRVGVVWGERFSQRLGTNTTTIGFTFPGPTYFDAAGANFSNQFPDVAVDSSGNTHVAYAVGGTIYYRRKLKDRSWEGPHKVISTNFPNPVRIAVGGDGVIWIIWRDADGTGVFYRRSTDGNTWSNGSDGGKVYSESGNMFSEDIAIGPDNLAHVVWYIRSNGTNKGQIRVADWDGSKFNTSSVTTDGFYDADPAIAVDNTNVQHVVWRKQLSSNSWAITYANRPSGGKWVNFTTIATTNGDAAYGPGIAVDEQRNVFITFSNPSGSTRHVLLYGKTPTSDWEFVLEMPKIGRDSRNSVAAKNGEAHVAYQTEAVRDQGQIEYIRVSYKSIPQMSATPVIADGASRTNQNPVSVSFTSISGNPTQIRWRWNAAPTDAANDSNGWQTFSNPKSIPLPSNLDRSLCQSLVLYTQVRNSTVTQEGSSQDSVQFDGAVQANVQVTNPFLAGLPTTFSQTVQDTYTSPTDGAYNGDPDYTRMPQFFLGIYNNNDCSGLAGYAVPVSNASGPISNNTFESKLTLGQGSIPNAGSKVTINVVVTDKLGNPTIVSKQLIYDPANTAQSGTPNTDGLPVLNSNTAPTIDGANSIIRTLTFSNVDVDDTTYGKFENLPAGSQFWGVWIANSRTPVTNPNSSSLQWFPVEVSNPGPNFSVNWNLFNGIAPANRGVGAYYIYVKFLDGAGNATVGTLPARQVNLAQGYSVPKIFLPEIRK